MSVIKKEKDKRVTEKSSSTSTLDEGRVASPGLSVEEITPRAKKRKTGDKGKEKVGASVWADARTTFARANEVVTPKELKEISGIPSHEMVSRHIQKLIQIIFFHFLFPSSIILSYISCSLRDFGYQVLGETMHITSQYL